MDFKQHLQKFLLDNYLQINKNQVVMSELNGIGFME